jgi:hypothetical protein
MPKRSGSSIFWEDTYVRLTLRPLNSLALIIVPLLVYHFCSARYGTSLLAPRHLGMVLGYFGASAAFLPPLLVAAVLLGQQAFSRFPWRIQLVALGGMVLESFAWTLPLMGLFYITSRLKLAAEGAASVEEATTLPSAFAQSCLQALGAGIYEEFMFRLVLVGLMIAALVHVLQMRRELADVLAILAGAVLFSLYHFSTEQFAQGDGFPWGQFVFRALAGGYLGGLYVGRGFGIVVGTHTVWNIWVAYLRS